MLDYYIVKYRAIFDKFCNRNYTTCFIDQCCGKNWGKCSKRHDIGYISNFENKTKEAIDLEFYECLKLNTWKWLAWLMYIAVSKVPLAKTYFDQYEKMRKK